MKYLFYTTFYTLLLTLALYTFVLGVDPYDVYGFNLLNSDYKAVRTARNDKFSYIDNHRNRFKTFIIGSSRAERFNPDLFAKILSTTAYNYSVENANAEDLLAITKHLIDTQRPTTIILFVDFYMFNGYIGFDRRFMRSPLKSYLKQLPKRRLISQDISLPYWHASYLSSRGLFDTLHLTLKKLNNEKQNPIYLSNGQHVVENADEAPQLAHAYFAHQYKDFREDSKRVAMFQEIKDLTDKNHIALRVVFTTMMPEHYNKILADKRLALHFHQFRKEMVSIFGQVIDFNNEDSSQFIENNYWYDSVHPTEKLADIMTSIICDVAPTRKKFGRILHPKSPQ